MHYQNVEIYAIRIGFLSTGRPVFLLLLVPRMGETGCVQGKSPPVAVSSGFTTDHSVVLADDTTNATVV